MPIPLALLLAAPQIALGATQAIGGFMGLRKLRREARPQYEISPELQRAYGMAEERSQMGYTPAQRSYFEQQMARQQQADYLNAIRLGGGTLSGAIAGALGGQRLSALNRFAMEDAGQQARNIAQFYGLAGQMQSQRNLRSQQDIAYRMAKERAMGGALQSGLTNVASGFGSMAAYKYMGLGSGKGGGGGTGNTGNTGTETPFKFFNYDKNYGMSKPYYPGISSPLGYFGGKSGLSSGFDSDYMGNNPFMGSLYKTPSMYQTEY